MGKIHRPHPHIPEFIFFHRFDVGYHGNGLLNYWGSYINCYWGNSDKHQICHLDGQNTSSTAPDIRICLFSLFLMSVTMATDCWIIMFVSQTNRQYWKTLDSPFRWAKYLIHSPRYSNLSIFTVFDVGYHSNGLLNYYDDSINEKKNKINKLLVAIGYRQLWQTSDMPFRSVKYLFPTQRYFN